MRPDVLFLHNDTKIYQTDVIEKFQRNYKRIISNA